jgi:dephospho-CoA kinase
LYRELTSTASLCTEALAHAFGKEILLSDGALDRSTLSRIVFCGGEEQKERLSRLNRITHTVILDECRKWLAVQEKKGVKAALINAPLLFESGFDSFCDFTIAVISEKKTRLERIMKRDCISEEAALMRINAQKGDEYYTSQAKYTVYNNESCENLNTQLIEILKSENLI